VARSAIVRDNAFRPPLFRRTPPALSLLPPQQTQHHRGAGENCLVFCQVGRFIEFYGGQRLVAARSLGLRTVYTPRAGYAFTVGFPARLSSVYRSRALTAGLAVLDVQQGDSLSARRCRARRPVQLFIPAWPGRRS
jgi:hypothetical protein